MTPSAHFDLTPWNTFGMKAYADWGLAFDSLAELQQILLDDRWRNLPRLVLGGGGPGRVGGCLGAGGGRGRARPAQRLRRAPGRPGRRNK